MRLFPLGRALTTALPLLALATLTASAQAAGPRVIATRDEVRVIFPADTAHAWGWPALPDTVRAGSYLWMLWVTTPVGTRTLSLGVDRPDTAAHRYPSLAALVASGRPVICPPGPFVSCGSQGLSASAQRGRVELRVTGRRQVEGLFALRPRSVVTKFSTPAMRYDSHVDTVRVEYGEPRIPRPSAALVASAERARRGEEASSRRFTRLISGGEPLYGALWMAVGDSVSLTAEESACHYDLCSLGTFVPAVSGWSVGDSSVIGIHPWPRDAARRGRGRAEAGVFAVARRTGRTVVRAHGVHGASDTIPSRSRPDRELEREVVVTRRIARVEIVPRVDTVRVGETREIQVRVYDVAGNRVNEAPAELRVTHTGGHGIIHGGVARAITFDVPGTSELTASFAGVTDRLAVTVLPASP